MDSLPLEICENICSTLVGADLKAVRFMSRNFATAALPGLLKDLVIMPYQQCLGNLGEISRAPDTAKCVQMITYDIRADRAGMWPLYAKLAPLLHQAARHLPNLKTFRIEDGNVPFSNEQKRLPKYARGRVIELPVASLEPFEPHRWLPNDMRLLLNALANCQRLEELTLAGRHWPMYFFDICGTPSARQTDPVLSRSLGKLKRLEITEAQSGIRAGMASKNLGMVCEMTHNLETLVVKLECHALDLEARNYRPISLPWQLKPWRRLHTLELFGFCAEEGELSRFFTSQSKTLKHLKLGNAKIVGDPGCWAETFSSISAQSNLETLDLTGDFTGGICQDRFSACSLIWIKIDFAGGQYRNIMKDQWIEDKGLGCMHDTVMRGVQRGDTQLFDFVKSMKSLQHLFG